MGEDLALGVSVGWNEIMHAKYLDPCLSLSIMMVKHSARQEDHKRVRKHRSIYRPAGEETSKMPADALGKGEVSAEAEL